MFPIERHNLILHLLDEKFSMTVEELANATGATNATIRRDLEKLDNQGLITRTHGGAVRNTNTYDTPFSVRDSENENEKIAVSHIALNYIDDGDTLFFDSSTTVMRMIPFLADKKGITVITNGLKTAFELGKMGISTICTGGKLANFNTLGGIEAFSAVNKYFVDKFFFSCKAIDEKGIYESSVQTVDVKQLMNRHAKKSFLLADHSKIGKRAFVKLDFFNNIDALITDAPVSLNLGVDVIWDKK